jgi:Fe-S cluster assembly ATP-binding protein
MKNILVIKNLHAEAEKKKILKGINLTIRSGEIHAIMGPNGSGKSTLLNVMLGHPRYKITQGSTTLNKKNILNLSPDKRSLEGIFGTFQHPVEIPGLNFGTFLRTAKNVHSEASPGIGKIKNQPRLSPIEFRKFAEKYLKLLKLDTNFLDRELNKNFSGGEKKKAEILQMAVLEPHIAFLDEIDSGLDVDALKTVATTIKKIAKKNNTGIVLITHYQRLLNYITPDFVHIIDDGKIIKSGKKELALKIEKEGYNSYIKQ